MNNIIDVDNSLIQALEEKKDVLKRTVAKAATNDEFEMFMHLAKQYGLDPFQKEIFFWKYDKDPTIMTSRDGYLKIANHHPEFNGYVADVVYENDSFKKLMDGVEHNYQLKDRGAIIGAYCLVYRKDRAFPVYVFAPYEDYKRNSQVWSNYPNAMILKCAESMALKRAFSVSGLVSKEEMGYQENQIVEGDFNDSHIINKKRMYKEISKVMEEKGISKEEGRQLLKRDYNVESVADLKNGNIKSFLDDLKSYQNESEVIDVEMSDEDLAEEVAVALEGDRGK